MIDGEISPLYGVLAFGVSRFRKVSAQRYEAVLLEVAHYVDFETRELFETLVIPGTGKTVAVPKYRTGPKEVAFGVRFDESETVPKRGRACANSGIRRRASWPARRPAYAYSEREICLRAHARDRFAP